MLGNNINSLLQLPNLLI